jgi:hypothetical protein
VTGHVEWNGDQIINEIEDRIWNNMQAVARDVVTVAKTYVHVRTGRLQRGLGFEADRATFSVVFTTEAPYGIFEEYGTRNRDAHPYWRPALNTVGPQYGFDFEFAFDATPQIHAPVLAAGETFRVPKTLTARQREHVLNRLKPVSQRHHIGNVSRAHLRVRGRRQY